MLGKLTDRQLQALAGRALKPGWAFTDRRRGTAHACEWLGEQLREHKDDPDGLRDLLHERWTAGIEFHSRDGALPRSNYGWGWDAILDYAAAIIQGDTVTINRFAKLADWEQRRAIRR